MKKFNVLGLLVTSLVMSFSAYGQMPTGNVLETTNCSRADGVSMSRIVEWFRANPRDPDSNNLVFVRQPVVAGPNFTDNYDFVIATYYGTYEAMIAQQQARRARGDGPRVRPTPLPGDMFSCDFGARSISLSRNIPGTDPFDGDETLLTSRLCVLNEGVSQADGYNFIAGVAENYRDGGSNSTMQVNTRAFGPIQNIAAGGAILVTSVSTTPESMAARLDLAREGLNVAPGVGDVMACRFSSMWRTFAVYRPDN